jgi:hypothetical protein
MIIDSSLVPDGTLSPSTFDYKWIEQARNDKKLIVKSLTVVGFNEKDAFVLTGVEFCQFESCGLSKCVFMGQGIKEFIIDQSSMLGNISFHKLQVDRFEINGKKQYSSGKLPELKFDNQCVFGELKVIGEFELVNIFKTSFSKISIDESKNVLIEDCNFNSHENTVLSILGSESVSVKRVKTSQLNLVGCSKEMYLENIQNLNDLMISNFKNPSDWLVFKDIKVSDRINFLDVNFNGLRIENVNLNATKNYFDDVELGSLVIKDSILPIELHGDYEPDNLKYYQAFQEIGKTNGLTSLMDQFKKQELISNFKIRKKEISKLSFSNKFDFFWTYRLPYWTSRFNYELWRPLGLFILVHLILNLIVIFLIWKPTFWCSPFWEGLWIYLGLSVHSILPTHSLDYGQLEIPVGVSFLMRVISSYFLYQIITVSRKVFRV